MKNRVNFAFAMNNYERNITLGLASHGSCARGRNPACGLVLSCPVANLARARHHASFAVICALSAANPGGGGTMKEDLKLDAIDLRIVDAMKRSRRLTKLALADVVGLLATPA